MPIREQQTTNRQHAIPQSIMSVEFKIIGDLTLRQFFFLLIFCGLAYASFMTVGAFIIKWLLVIFFVGLGLCFAFLPLGDRGLDVWIINFLKAMLLPNQFVYRKQEAIPNVFLYQNLDVLRSELITLTPTSSRRKIEAYLEQQEAPFDKLDIDEKSYILKVKEAYSSGYAGFSSSSVTTTVVEDVPQPNTIKPSTTEKIDTTSEEIQVTTSTPVTTTPAPVAPPSQNLTELELPAPKAWQSQPIPSIVKPVVVASAPTPQVVQKTQAEPAPLITPSIIKPIADNHNEIIRRDTVAHHETIKKQPQVQDSYYSPTMTPDMHIGRRFINLAGEAGRGEIILPIRGEQVLKSIGSAQFDRDETEKESQKVQQLDNLINQIKSREVVQKQLIESQKIKDEEEAKKRRLAEETQGAKQREVVKEQARLEAEEKARQQVAQEQERLQKLRDQEEQLRHQKEGLIKKQRTDEEERQKREKERVAMVTVATEAKDRTIPLKSAQTAESPSIANIIWGLVITNYQGGKVPVPGVVVVIRNQRNEVVRAVKTSALGKFGITTPLINGAYTVEVDKEKKSGLTFEISAFEAKGEPIPTIEIVGKA